MKALEDKVQRYEAFLKADPENTVLLISLGDLYHQVGEFESARSKFQAVLQLDSEHKIAKSRLAAVLMSEGQMEEALSLLLSIKTQESSDPVIALNIAICQFTLYRFEEAKQAFRDLVSVTGVDRSARYYLASVYQVENKVDAALQMVNELLAEQEEVYLLGYKSTLLYTLGRLDEAAELANIVLNNDDTNPDACSTLGTFYAEKLEINQSELFFQKMLKRAPGDARGWHGLGIVTMQRGHLDSALELFEKSTELLPKSAGMWTTLAWAYFNSRAYLKAELAFDRVIQLNRNNPEGLGGKACALAMQSKFKDANSAADAAMRLDKTSFSAVFAKSLLLALKGKKETADSILENLLKQPIRPGGDKAIDLINRYMSMHYPAKTDSNNRPSQPLQ